MNASTREPHVLTPPDLGFLRLKNRIPTGSMHTGLEQAADGAHGGVGMIITGGTAPNAEAGVENLRSACLGRSTGRTHRLTLQRRGVSTIGSVDQAKRLAAEVRG